MRSNWYVHTGIRKTKLVLSRYQGTVFGSTEMVAGALERHLLMKLDFAKVM